MHHIHACTRARAHTHKYIVSVVYCVVCVCVCVCTHTFFSARRSCSSRTCFMASIRNISSRIFA